MTLPARTELLAKGGGDGHNGCGSIHCGDGDEPARAVPNVIVQEINTIALADAAIQVAVDAVMVMVCLYFQVQWQAAARHQLQQQRQQGNGG